MMNLNFEVRGEQYSYPVSARDQLMLTRAVAREGKPYDAVAWTLIQRFAWLYPSGAFNSLGKLVEAYAQPINPRWFPEGDKHKAALRKAKTETRKEQLEERAERRLDYADATYDEIDPKFANLVEAILSGNVDSPVPGAVHYTASQAPSGSNDASAREEQEDFARERKDLKHPIYTTSSQRGFNWFFDVSGSKVLKVNILETMMPSSQVVNLGTQDNPVTAIVYILTGLAAKQLADKLKT